MFRVRELVCGLAIGGLAAAASADVIINLNFEFSSGSNPSGTAPWATATFKDLGGGVVRLTMDEKLQSLAIPPGEFLGKAGPNDQGWLFNLDPTLDASKLIFTHRLGTAAFVTTGSNDAYRPDGDGFFDIRFGWTAGLVQGSADVVYELKMMAGFGVVSESSFNILSKPGPGGSPGPFVSAAHVQSIGGSGGPSGWIGDFVIPLPTTAGMAFAGLLGLGCVRRRRAL